MNQNDIQLNESLLDLIKECDQRELFPFELLDEYARRTAMKMPMPIELSQLIHSACEETPVLKDDIETLVQGWECEVEKSEPIVSHFFSGIRVAASFLALVSAGLLSAGGFGMLQPKPEEEVMSKSFNPFTESPPPPTDWNTYGLIAGGIILGLALALFCWSFFPKKIN